MARTDAVRFHEGGGLSINTANDAAMQAPATVLVANEHAGTVARAATLVEAAGHRVVVRVTDVGRVGHELARTHPDLAVVSLHDDAASALAFVERVCGAAPCPVVLLLDRDDPALVRQALDRGVHAYADRGTPGSLESAVELARRRHGEVRDLGRQVRALEERAARRAVIEQAKGVLMERRGVSERASYEILRAAARDARTSVAGMAASVVGARALLHD